MRDRHDNDNSNGRPAERCDDIAEAAADAERMISRMQDIATEALHPESDQDEAFEDLIGELDPAPEGDALRKALGMDSDGSRDLPKGRERQRDGGEKTASPEDEPPEYRTWRTGP